MGVTLVGKLKACSVNEVPTVTGGVYVGERGVGVTGVALGAGATVIGEVTKELRTF